LKTNRQGEFSLLNFLQLLFSQKKKNSDGQVLFTADQSDLWANFRRKKIDKKFFFALQRKKGEISESEKSRTLFTCLFTIHLLLLSFLKQKKGETKSFTFLDFSVIFFLLFFFFIIFHSLMDRIIFHLSPKNVGRSVKTKTETN
jgi:hypothetical protein